MRGYYRHTKIIATVGPATESEEKLGQLNELREAAIHSSPEAARMYEAATDWHTRRPAL